MLEKRCLLSRYSPFPKGNVNGDQVSLGYILKTLNRKSYIIEGVTANPNITVTAAGESAFYYKRAAASVIEGTTGAKVDWAAGNSKGVTRKSIDMTTCFQIADAIPHANFSTVSADVVGDRVVLDTITVANEWNKKYLAKLVSGGTAKTYAGALTLDNVYTTIIGAKATFITDHKTDYMRPESLFVAPDVMALLKAKNLVLFKDNLPGKSEKLEGYFDEMAVIEAPDLAAGQFIIMNCLGAGSPLNVNNFYVTDGTAAGYIGGTLITSELSYGLEICDPTLIYVYSKQA